ncbi:hypothetical protein ACFWPV_25695 [Streptomyces uncialis]|uniref:hypothetical protein n=1 Tax=Streptomyces uncialis TaxID=1048205 RepID=UPI0036527DDF
MSSSPAARVFVAYHQILVLDENGPVVHADSVDFQAPLLVSEEGEVGPAASGGSPTLEGRQSRVAQRRTCPSHLPGSS